MNVQARGTPRGNRVLATGLTLLTLGWVFATATFADGALLSVHLPDGSTATTSVDLDIEGDFTAEMFSLADPPRFILDLVGTTGRSATLPVGTAQVLRVRTAQYRTDPPVVRLVFDLAYPTTPTLEPRKGGLRVRFPPGPTQITEAQGQATQEPLPIVETKPDEADENLDPPLPLIEVGAGVAVTPPLRPASAADELATPEIREAEIAANNAEPGKPESAEQVSMDPPGEPSPTEASSSGADEEIATEAAHSPREVARPTLSPVVGPAATPVTPAERVPGLVLVLKDGQRMHLREPWRHDGRRILFTTKSGIFSSIRTGEVDIEASSTSPP